mgnify:CR=1 FL=1
MIELSCHGSPVILRRVLDLTQNFGARLAEPGEFTLRACKNGKMNLSQAEAIRDLIDAQTDAAAATSRSSIERRTCGRSRTGQRDVDKGNREIRIGTGIR